MNKISESILKFFNLENLFQSLTGYVESRVELLKLEIREDVAKAIAQGLVVMALVLVGFLFLVFFSVGLAHFLGSYFQAPYTGYWLVAGIYGVTFLLVLVFKKGINRYFEQHISESIKRKGK